MLPISGIIFLSLLGVVVVILGIVNLVLGKSFYSCCCKDDGKTLDDTDGEIEGLLELDEKDSGKFSTIKIHGKTKVTESESYPTDGVDSSNDDDGISFSDNEEILSTIITKEEEDFEVGPVLEKRFVRAVPNMIVRTFSAPNRPQRLYYGTMDNHSPSVKSLSINNDSSSNFSTNFNGIESVSIQVLVTFDEGSKTLSSGVKLLEIGRNHQTIKKTNSSKLFWQVVTEVIDQQKSELLINQRVKTKYKSGDKIHFQRNLDTEDMDYDYLDNLFVRYSVFARRGTRVSHKQLFGQTNVFLTKLRKQNIIFEWRAIPFLGTNILELNNDERLI